MSRSHEARKRLRTWVEGVALAPAVTGRVLLDAATYLTWSIASELDDMKGIEDAGCVLELIVDGVLSVPGRGPAPWDDPPLEWSTMPVSSRGPAALVLVMPHVLINPQHPNPRKTGRVIRCGSQTRLDTGPHGVPRGCQLSGQASDGGSFEAQLSDHPHNEHHRVSQ